MKSKFRFSIMIFFILILSFPAYANVTYKRVYYGNDLKFINQYDTGAYGYSSCLPTSIKMILEYEGVECDDVSKMFSEMNGDSSGVPIPNATKYLDLLPDVSYSVGYIHNKDVFKWYIDQDIPCIIVINPYLINRQKDTVVPVLSKRIGKDYGSYQDSVHAIAIIGYVENDGKLFLEVLDPLSRGILFYEIDNVMDSLVWNKSIIIKKVEKSTE